MTVKYYGVPFTEDQIRKFIKMKTGVLVTHSRAERIFSLYKDIQKYPCMANSDIYPGITGDISLLYKSGLVFPMGTPLSPTNYLEWAINHMKMR